MPDVYEGSAPEKRFGDPNSNAKRRKAMRKALSKQVGSEFTDVAQAIENGTYYKSSTLDANESSRSEEVKKADFM